MKKVLSGKDNTNGFQKNPKNINRKGAPVRKTISSVNISLEASGYSEASPADVTSCYLRLINIDLPELTKMINDKEQPALVRIVGKSILSGKGFDVIESMLNRTLGKAIQKTELTGKDGKDLECKTFIQWGDQKIPI